MARGTRTRPVAVREEAFGYQLSASSRPDRRTDVPTRTAVLLPDAEIVLLGDPRRCARPF